MDLSLTMGYFLILVFFIFIIILFRKHLPRLKYLFPILFEHPKKLNRDPEIKKHIYEAAITLRRAIVAAFLCLGIVIFLHWEIPSYALIVIQILSAILILWAIISKADHLGDEKSKEIDKFRFLLINGIGMWLFLCTLLYMLFKSITSTP